MKTLLTILLIIVSFTLGALVFHTCNPTQKDAKAFIFESDTIIIYDTIYASVPEPKTITVVRYDTITTIDRIQKNDVPTILTDTIPQNDIIIPITQQTYHTEDYKAIVEGFRPRLVSMELYPKTTIIENTTIKTSSPRWVLSVGPGIGYGPKGVEPYIGINAGFVLWSK